MSVPAKSFEPGVACPLDGVRVIDMSRLVSGNMVSLQLADFACRHGRRGPRGLCGDGVAASGRGEGRWRPGDRSAIARPAVFVYRDRSGDLPADRDGARTHRQPLRDDLAT